MYIHVNISLCFFSSFNYFQMFLFLIFLPLAFTFDYSIKLDEETPINKIIYQFSHSYELLNNFQASFNLINYNKDLILTKTIDRDYWCLQNICSCETCSFILQLLSNDNKNSPIFSTINITIIDINDHSCQFLDIENKTNYIMPLLAESVQ